MRPDIRARFRDVVTRAIAKADREYAAHLEALRRSSRPVTPGQRVEFRVVETERGPRATDVRPVEFITVNGTLMVGSEDIEVERNWEGDE